LKPPASPARAKSAAKHYKRPVELLLVGVPIERVSVLLGHSSTRITEKHYSAWVRARQEELEADMRQSWQESGLISSGGGTKLRTESELVN